MIRARRRTTIRIVVAVAGVLLASLAPPVSATATPQIGGTARAPVTLREQVRGLFDRIDHVSRVIESVGEEIASARERISKLSRSIDAQQQILNRRAAEVYMGGFAGGIESVLGASSFADSQVALEFLNAVAQRDNDVLVALEQRKAEIEQQRIRAGSLEVELRRRRERLEGTVTDLVEKLDRQWALSRADETGSDPRAIDPTPIPRPGPPPTSPAPTRDAVRRLIRDRFAPLGSRASAIAVCVAERESGLDPLAMNPATGAAGLFQFLPSTWASLSELAGRAGASVFDAGANVAVAAWTVASYGWHPWRSVAADCAA